MTASNVLGKVEEEDAHFIELLHVNLPPTGTAIISSVLRIKKALRYSNPTTSICIFVIK